MAATATRPNYLDPTILSKIARLDMRARLVVEGFISGLHRSPYHGLSVEFAQHRQYVPGDDVSHIDWKVWARADRFYIKQYEEETNLRCTLILDASKSMAYGRPDTWNKFDYAATVTASLAYLLHRQQDAVGLVLFDRAIRQTLPPSTHRRHLHAMVQVLQKSEPDATSDVSDVLLQLAGQLQRRGLVILVSDLLFDLDALRKGLRQLRHNRHEVVLFQVLHADELTFPFQENTLFRGLEVETELMTEPTALRQAYLEALESFQRQVRRICSEVAIDHVVLSTEQHLDAALSRYLASRQRVRHTYGKS